MNEELNIEILQGIGGWGFSYQSLTNQLRGFKGSKIKVPLNSFGGDAFQALAIHNTLMGHKASVEINIVAYAASAGTMIACCGDRVTMADNGFYMMHNPSGYAEGKAPEMETTAKLLKDLTDSMVAMYYDRIERSAKAKGQAPKLTKDEIRQMMADTTWLPAAKALEYGFVDALTKGAKFEASADVQFFANVPEVLKPQANTATPPVVAQNLNHQIKMDDIKLSIVAGFLGLGPTATAADVQQAIFDTRQRVSALTAENTALKADNQKYKDAEVKAQGEEAAALIATALQEEKITNEQVPMWQENFKASHDSSKRLLASMTGKVFKLSNVPQTGANGGTTTAATGTTYLGMTYKELDQKNPQALKQLNDSDPATFKALFKASYGVEWTEPK
jgi:ATP-dependent protease ClpP protease subunit